jgi:succinyl-diaminopimelate desuccinylase
MKKTLALTQELIARRSITPNDAGCQQLIEERLEAHGFTTRHYPFGDVSNIWLQHGDARPLLVFLGHTDVVPPGPEDAWASPPFTPEIRGGHLFGRGAADMKGNIAAFVTAVERFVHRHPRHRGAIAILLTSDEEGPSVDGTRRVIDALLHENVQIDWCLVGEPGSEKQLGDTIKIGRRGSMTAKLIIKGKQGHIAYPQLAKNPIHQAAPFICELTSIKWDQGNDHFDPTSCQIAHIHAGTGASNIIPGTLEIIFNFRFAPVVTAGELQQRVAALLDKHELEYDIDWVVGGQPFYTVPQHFVHTVSAAITEVLGVTPKLSTSGGTSDGRFVASTAAEIVEFGLINATIHQLNEHVLIDDLERLSQTYERILEKLLAD